MKANSSSFGSTEVQEILKLEQLFHNKFLNTDFLHELIALYVKVIEVFTPELAFMKNYFFEKMQFVLSRPEIIKLLQHGGDSVQQIRQTLRVTTREEEEKHHTQDRQFAHLKEKIVEKETHHHYHYEQSENKNLERNKKLDMKVKVMREVETNMKQLEKQVRDQDKKLEIKGEMVKDIQKKQADKLNERLERRKKKLRKKSVEIKPNVKKDDEEETEPEPVIQKAQLKEAQRELTAAVMKFTIRMTARTKKEEQQAGGHARVKNKKIESIEEDVDLLQDQDEKPAPIKTEDKHRGRIKTKREEEPEADYW